MLGGMCVWGQVLILKATALGAALAPLQWDLTWRAGALMMIAGILLMRSTGLFIWIAYGPVKPANSDTKTT